MMTITSESSFAFAISVDDRDHWLEQRGGEWRLDGRWIASARIEWPEALARSLRVVRNVGLSRRTEVAIQRRGVR